MGLFGAIWKRLKRERRDPDDDLPVNDPNDPIWIVSQYRTQGERRRAIAAKTRAERWRRLATHVKRLWGWIVAGIIILAAFAELVSFIWHV